MSGFGFDGLNEAATLLRRLKKEQEERKRDELEKVREKEREERWKAGGATLDEMEEFYQEQRGKFSEAYFSGSPFYVGSSFKDWYLSSGRARSDVREALVWGAMLTAVGVMRE